MTSSKASPPGGPATRPFPQETSCTFPELFSSTLSLSIWVLFEKITSGLSQHLAHVCVCSCLLVSHFLWTPWTLAHQAPLSMECPRQEHWNGLPFPSRGDLLDPGIKSVFSALQMDSLPFSHQEDLGFSLILLCWSNFFGLCYWELFYLTLLYTHHICIVCVLHFVYLTVFLLSSTTRN